VKTSTTKSIKRQVLAGALANMLENWSGASGLGTVTAFSAVGKGFFAGSVATLDLVSGYFEE